jgi:hypothetical protein
MLKTKKENSPIIDHNRHIIPSNLRSPSQLLRPYKPKPHQSQKIPFKKIRPTTKSNHVKMASKNYQSNV